MSHLCTATITNNNNLLLFQSINKNMKKIIGLQFFKSLFINKYWFLLGVVIAIILAWQFPNVGKRQGYIHAEWSIKWGKQYSLCQHNAIIILPHILVYLLLSSDNTFFLLRCCYYHFFDIWIVTKNKNISPDLTSNSTTVINSNYQSNYYPVLCILSCIALF